VKTDFWRNKPNRD